MTSAIRPTSLHATIIKLCHTIAYGKHQHRDGGRETYKKKRNENHPHKRTHTHTLTSTYIYKKTL